MIIDHRTYTVHPHKFGEFLKVYEELGFELFTLKNITVFKKERINLTRSAPLLWS